jgi:hypothetical protein
MSIISVDYGSITGGGANCSYDVIPLTYNVPYTVDTQNCEYRVGAAVANADWGCGYVLNGEHTNLDNYGITTSYSSGTLSITLSTSASNMKLFLFNADA